MREQALTAYSCPLSPLRARYHIYYVPTQRRLYEHRVSDDVGNAASVIAAAGDATCDSVQRTASVSNKGA
ncbi:MAG: hypothetical protein H0X67_24495 [Acidobacteria bacterium]|nr:hypothetical protein [Acidobacteriota bacterium]